MPTAHTLHLETVQQVPDVEAQLPMPESYSPADVDPSALSAKYCTVPDVPAEAQERLTKLEPLH